MINFIHLPNFEQDIIITTILMHMSMLYVKTGIGTIVLLKDLLHKSNI